MSRPTATEGLEPDDDALREVDRQILRAVRDVSYGSVEITIHDSRVVQIERKEKLRLNR